MFSIPNIFSILRIVLSPLCFFFFLSDDPLIVQIGCIIYLIAASTDYIDGWIARKFKSYSKMGTFIDPLADKILTTSVFLAFVILDILPLWMVIIVILRDFAATFLRIYADKKNRTMRTSLTAKWKTFLQMTFISYLIVLLFFLNMKMSRDFNFQILAILKSNSTQVLMLILTLFSIWTIIEYIFENKDLIKLIFKIRSEDKV
ncbi:MAG: CDP-diacylglycerol--glycerol-3-phosphate 3-phosphatidyltransferase [Candidatus Kapabacteria bacterium]|nr:CDP-diacylglycerol--glycerol-3-phosphate 3-phosphatidyltransferase [Candidatus Kapabacteria bacterium]